MYYLKELEKMAKRLRLMRYAAQKVLSFRGRGGNEQRAFVDALDESYFQVCLAMGRAYPIDKAYQKLLAKAEQNSPTTPRRKIGRK